MMDQLTLVVINGILCGLLVISIGKLVYWKGQAKFHKNSANELYKHVHKQSEYIKRLRAKCDAYSLHEQIFNHELSRRPPIETVVADSAKQGEKQ